MLDVQLQNIKLKFQKSHSMNKKCKKMYKNQRMFWVLWGYFAQGSNILGNGGWGCHYSTDQYASNEPSTTFLNSSKLKLEPFLCFGPIRPNMEMSPQTLEISFKFIFFISFNSTYNMLPSTTFLTSPKLKLELFLWYGNQPTCVHLNILIPIQVLEISMPKYMDLSTGSG